MNGRRREEREGVGESVREMEEERGRGLSHMRAV